MFAFLLPALAACVTARWPASDPSSLALLHDTPINCVLAESVTEEFREAAGRAGIRVLNSGELELPARKSIDFQKGPLVATSQGLWPGIHVEKDGAAHAAPTGALWIDTNAGFLRFAKASAGPKAAVWMGNRPPADRVLNGRNYVHAIGDAAMNGARWVIDFQPAFWEALLRREPKALSEWERIVAVVRFYETNRELCDLPDYSGLALVEDESDGALLSGGFLDMLAARHIPAYALSAERLDSGLQPGLQMLLNVDPAGMTAEERAQAAAAARRGATLVNGPPGWKVALPQGEAITFDKDQIKALDEAWREINGLVGRRNFGVRVFGAPGMLSNLKSVPGQERLVLHLLNYTDYAVESISVHFRDKFTSARLLTPEGEKKAELYEVDGATAVDIAKIVDAGILIVE